MRIDVLKAADGVTYPFGGEEFLTDDLFSPRAVAFDGAVRIEGTYVVEKGVVSVDFRWIAPMTAVCDRCLDEVKFEIAADGFAEFRPDAAKEDGAYSYRGSVVDLSDALREEIVLSLPASILCKPDCKGLCPVCGANRNRETCGCGSPNQTSPFAILNQTILGGANDGSTEK